MHDEKKNEAYMPPTEDLMQEHGVLNRVLLIYEEIIARLDHGEFPHKALNNAVDIIETFIENYHEKTEEEYIFPLFEKAKKKLNLVKTLRLQHQKGRAITARLKEILRLKKHDAKNIKETRTLLKKFIRMYRPHEAREDTELFPLVRSLLSEKEFHEIGEKFESSEHELLGKGGFEVIVQRVEAIEKELGIYKLEQFTP